ncbi:MAG: 4Fe-4S cluster-binding domain-containing protein [Bacillota bacterium]|nr:4Fe-4S cluster-binding domain-containing protein [Bacillota bacterium]
MKQEYKSKTIMLTITEDCNLNCVYCYQKNKSKKEMSIEKAQELIRKYVEKFSDSSQLRFDLAGGEVFLRQNFIKEICEWTWSQDFGENIIFFATTNGTLVHGEIQEWLYKNRTKIYVGLSLDGTRDMDNKNRSNSFDLIDFEFFKRTWPNQGVKMTISPYTLPKISKGIIELHEKGIKVMANLAYLCDWSDPEYKDIFRRELKILADYYISHPEQEISSILNVALEAIITQKDSIVKWCGTGTHMIALDSEGNEYPCHFFMPSTMPNNIDWKKINFSDIEKLQDKKCKECIYLPVCPTCYGASSVQYGTPSIRDKNLCEMNKIRVQAASYLWGKKLVLGQLKTENANLLNNTIAAIKKVQEDIDN